MHLCQSISLDVSRVVLHRAGRVLGLRSWLTLTGRICSVRGQYACAQHLGEEVGEVAYLALAAKDARPRDSLHGCRSAVFCHPKISLP